MTNNYISLQEEDTQVAAGSPDNNPNIFPQDHHQTDRSESSSDHQESSEMSDIEVEMFSVAESAFNRKRAQAHEEIDKLYDEMIRSAKNKVKGLTASIVAEVSGE